MAAVSVAFAVYFFWFKPRPYIVVIDPGHGGRAIWPESVYGDKYIDDQQKYSDYYKPGAYFKGSWEAEEVFEIAKKIEKVFLLKETHPEKFKSILRKYKLDHLEPQRSIKVVIPRDAGFFENYSEKKEDINAPYRHYDYRDILTHQKKKGLISRINDLNPHLVVSMHLTGGRPHPNGGMAAIITPSVDIYQKALDFSKSSEKEKKEIKDWFYRSKYKHWKRFGGRDHFYSFIADASIYFTGAETIGHTLKIRKQSYEGLRHNMVTWRYSSKGTSSTLVNNLRQVNLAGPFWEREKYIAEKWRRSGPAKKIGGDNHFAADELMRFIRYGFLVNKDVTKEKENTLPEIIRPYFSTWSMPTYTNAINAFLELGHIDSQKDYNRIMQHKQVYAEAIAMGIYSLFNNSEKKYEPQKQKYQMPTRNPLDFARYEKLPEGNYFEIVSKKE